MKRIKDFLSDRLPLLKGFFKKRYNIIQVKTLRSGWSDRDDLMTHAMFQILTDFVEEEIDSDWVDWSATEEHQAAYNEMKRLYKWWHEEYLPYEENGFLEYFDPNTGKEKEGAFEKYSNKIKEMEKKLQEELINLIKVKDHMWT